MVYDVIVIGGGPGGYLAAQRAGQAGLSVLLLEENRLGGTCLNAGCIPTKTFLRSARLYYNSKNAQQYGVDCQSSTLDHSAVLKRKNRVSNALVAGVQSGLRAAGVRVVNAKGTVSGRCSEGFVVAAQGENFQCRKLILASGSRPILPRIEGLDAAIASKFALGSRELLDLPELPEHLCVIGGGVIGLEMATYFLMAGVSVSIVEATKKLGGNIDSEISSAVQAGCEKLGAEIFLSSQAVRIEETGVIIQTEGKSSRISCDRVLLCVGRYPNLDSLGLEKLHIPADGKGIRVDEYSQTGISGVYAVGDCTGLSMQAHVAYRQAEVAVRHILGEKDPLRILSIPSLIHTEPEAASVGMTPEAAKAEGFDTVISRISMNYSGLYMAEIEDGNGFIKLVFDRKRRVLIGAHIVGGPASELITLCSVFIDNELPVDRIKEYVFPHPTYGEAIREAIFAAKL